MKGYIRDSKGYDRELPTVYVSYLEYSLTTPTDYKYTISYQERYDVNTCTDWIYCYISLHYYELILSLIYPLYTPGLHYILH